MSEEQRKQYVIVKPVRRAIRQADGWSNFTNEEIISVIKTGVTVKFAAVLFNVQETRTRIIAATIDDLFKPAYHIGGNRYGIKQNNNKINK